MQFRLPEIGEGVYEVELVRWLVSPGEAVIPGQGVLEVLTDKATNEVPAPFSGTVTDLKAEPGTMIKVGDVILEYQKGEPVTDPSATPTHSTDDQRPAPRERRDVTAASASSSRHDSNGPTATQQQRHGAPVASPSVRHLARKLGIDLTRVRGSGPAGRILLDDLTPLIRTADQPEPKPRRKSAIETLDLGRPGTRIKFQGVRRRIAEHMLASKEAIPHYSYVDECDVTELVRLRDSLKEPLAGRGVKLTYLAFFVKAAALALRDVPFVNSSLDEENGDIVLHEHRHVGFAVASKAGLLVPVIRDADKLDVLSIAGEIERLTSQARAGRSRREDLIGGTFTITSVGGIGGLISTPIINYPESAILGLGKVVKRPVYDGQGQLRPADIIYLSLTFDHRIIDGAVGAAFGNALIEHLLKPALLLLPEG